MNTKPYVSGNGCHRGSGQDAADGWATHERVTWYYLGKCLQGRSHEDQSS